MNVEQAYIKSIETERVIEIVKKRLNGDFKDIHLDSQMEIPDSYDTIIVNDVKRKIAISSSENGWITIIESKEFNDYAMLLHLSKELQTEVLAVVQSDATGTWGFVEMFEGKIVKSYFSEEDDEIEDLIELKLKQKEICKPLYMFREVVKERRNGWVIVQIHNKDN